MSTTALHVEPFTLVHSKPDDRVLSFRHRVLAASGAYGEEKSAASIMSLIKDGTYEIVTDPTVKPSLRTCLECGCTDDYSCAGGCDWAGILLCSRCAGDSMRPRQDIEADVELAFSCGLTQANEGVHRLAVIQTEVLLDIRDILMHGAVASEAEEDRLAILERIAERSERRIITAGAEILR